MRLHTAPYTLLLADDHRLITDGISKILSDEEIIGDIFTVHDGLAAVEVVMNRNIDCVIMDINMPGLNGVEATKRIKKLQPSIKIIAVSMLSDAAIVSKMLKAGASGFINKDTGKTELVLALKKVMQGERYISHDISENLIAQLADPDSYINDSEKHLTRREAEIVQYIAEGLTNREIAERLFLSVATVQTHRKNILAKLHLKNTASLVKFAAENHLL